MMDDRELLEMAAKAAGRPDWDHAPYIKSDEGNAMPWWNPLADDGDALRLAVTLGLDVCCSGDQTDVSDGTDLFVCVEVHREDMAVATRRAIVRAAAEIGRSIVSASNPPPNENNP